MKIIVVSVLTVIGSSALAQSVTAIAPTPPSSSFITVQYNPDRDRREDAERREEGRDVRGEERRDDRREERREEQRGDFRFSIGDQLPPNLLDRAVNDWRREGLGRPPGGREWVRVGDRFMLVRLRDRRIEQAIDADRVGRR